MKKLLALLLLLPISCNMFGAQVSGGKSSQASAPAPADVGDSRSPSVATAASPLLDALTDPNASSLSLQNSSVPQNSGQGSSTTSSKPNPSKPATTTTSSSKPRCTTLRRVQKVVQQQGYQETFRRAARDFLEQCECEGQLLDALASTTATVLAKLTMDPNLTHAGAHTVATCASEAFIWALRCTTDQVIDFADDRGLSRPAWSKNGLWVVLCDATLKTASVTAQWALRTAVDSFLNQKMGIPCSPDTQVVSTQPVPAAQALQANGTSQTVISGPIATEILGNLLAKAQTYDSEHLRPQQQGQSVITP